MDCELLAPAGNFETALAAFEAGADAVYCGLPAFSARAFADNVTPDDLGRLLRYAHARGRRVHVTFNTLVDERALDDAVDLLARLDELRPDALIVQDLGLARICRRHFPSLELHASTQLVAHNLEGVLALGDLGFRRVVLARELSLDEIAFIAKRCGDIALECFVHGALCYSISGLCLFGAMERGRSGNRGTCPYCCRMAYDTDENGKTLAFSMKDLRLGADARRLVDAGVASLKIEGRMKSALYVASATRYYRQILGESSTADGGSRRPSVTPDDLATVFSRRTTELYLNGRPAPSDSPPDSPIDTGSLGHLGAAIGVVKHVTKDREGASWLRFHTQRALERHDGLQFDVMVDGRPVGLGIAEMRQAIARTPVFEVAAGTDVEVRLPGDGYEPATPRPGGEASYAWATLLVPGTNVYCSMSNAVKRMFPAPGFRPSDAPGDETIDLEVTLAPESIVVVCTRRQSAGGVGSHPLSVSVAGAFGEAKNPEKTEDAVRKAFSKLGETDYRLGRLAVNDPGRLFAPMSALNALRRQLVEALDAARAARRRDAAAAVRADDETPASDARTAPPARRIKLRLDQRLPSGAWDEVVLAFGTDQIGQEGAFAEQANSRFADSSARLRLALPVWNGALGFSRLRVGVKRLIRAGFVRWEASDLATLRLLRTLGVTDVTVDWTLYATNSRALATLAELGARRMVASPENGRANLQELAESGYDVEFLVQQSTPLFLSLTRPGGAAFADEPPPLRFGDVVSFVRDGLWVTTKPTPRTFDPPVGVSTRVDLSWDPGARQLS